MELPYGSVMASKIALLKERLENVLFSKELSSVNIHLVFSVGKWTSDSRKSPGEDGGGAITGNRARKRGEKKVKEWIEWRQE